MYISSSLPPFTLLPYFLHCRYRAWVLCLSNLISTPFCYGAVMLPSPWCLVSLLPSFILGEMWVGVTIAMVLEASPLHLRAPAVSLCEREGRGWGRIGQGRVEQGGAGRSMIGEGW